MDDKTKKKVDELTTVVNPVEQAQFENMLWLNWVSTVTMNTFVLIHLPIVRDYTDEQLESYSDNIVNAWGDATRVTLSKRLEEKQTDIIGTLYAMFYPEKTKNLSEKERQTMSNALVQILERAKNTLFITFKAAVEKYRKASDM